MFTLGMFLKYGSTLDQIPFLSVSMAKLISSSPSLFWFTQPVVQYVSGFFHFLLISI